ncbi:hypothetical protein ACVWXQ_004643 [Bradyrhizobium sp. S3.14.4]
MRDDAGELADRLHLLGLDQLLLGGALLGDVLDEIVDDGAPAELERRARRLDQDLVAVPMQQRRFEPDADRRIRQFRQKPHHALPEAVAERLGDEEVDDVGAERLLARPSGEGLGLDTPFQDDAVRIGLNESVERGLDDGLGHLCAGLGLLGQLRGGAFVLRRFDRARAQPCEQDRDGAAYQQSDDLGQAEPGPGIGGEEGRGGHGDLRGHRECQKRSEFHGLTPATSIAGPSRSRCRLLRLHVSYRLREPASRGNFRRGAGVPRAQPAGESVWRSVVTQITRAACWVGLSNMCGTMLGKRKLSPASSR